MVGNMVVNGRIEALAKSYGSTLSDIQRHGFEIYLTHSYMRPYRRIGMYVHSEFLKS